MLGILARVRIRWWIFGFMCAFAFFAYVQRQVVTVAAEPMMPDLAFSQMQVGLLYWAFVAGYTCLQFPGGLYGQRVGARRAFIVISIVAFAAVLATPTAPMLIGGGVLFAVLMIAQFVLGVAQAPVFPVSAGVFESWFPASRWSLVLGLQAMFMNFGSAVTPPLIANLMQSFGWRAALVWASLPALVLVALWAWYGRDTPREHPGVSPAELAELGDVTPVAGPARIDWPRIGRLLRNRDLVLITFSYLCMNYVFYLLSGWCFLYLVQQRHFTILESGWLASLPPLGAALGSVVGGKLGSTLFIRFGPRWGFRLIPLIALPGAGVLLIVAVQAANPYWAVAALTAAYASVELIEGPAWAAQMYIARADTMAATGLLNTGGNLGGLIGIPIVAYLSGHGMWTTAFVVGSGFALASGLAWLAVDATRRFNPEGVAGAG
ncbi:MAG: MFS transporter [Steroidobacteraceae bacterium]